MFKRILAGVGTSVMAATVLGAQAPAPPQGGAPDAGRAAQGPGGRGGGRGGAPKMPTEAEWAAMPAKAKEYVDKARALAGTDPDL